MCREFFWKNLTGLFITPDLQTGAPHPYWRNSEAEKPHHAHIHIYFGNVQRCIVFGRTYGLLLIVFSLSVFLSHSVFNIWGIFQMKLKRLTDACLRYYRYQVAQRGYIYCMRKKEWFQILTNVKEIERVIFVLWLQNQIFENKWRKLNRWICLKAYMSV